MYDVSFTQELIQENLDIWERCLNSDFLRQLETNTLDEACFKGYMVEDSLYLREYAKVFAWGMTKAEDMESVRNYYSLLSFVNEGEGATRLYYLKRYGITDEEIQHLPLRPENRAYTDCMVQAARDGEGAPECMMACLPCMVSYEWIFQRLLARSPGVRETPYWPLVRDYASANYETACQNWSAFTDRVCRDLSPARRERCRKIFRDCSLHELHFWEMSAKPRTDI